MPDIFPVTSADGTRIECERIGDGPPLVLIEPAGHYRDLSAFAGLVPKLARWYTVVTYDRRGRGGSGDTAPFAPEREVDDLAAVLSAAGTPVFVYGYSSGALLALRAAASDLSIVKLAAMEPPLQEPGASPDPLTGELAALTEAGRFDEAVMHFHRSVGVPDEYIDEMRNTPTFSKMAAIAPTLVYDCMISDATTPDLLAAVRTPTLVLDSAGSTDDLTGWAAEVARGLPNATHLSLPGQWHTVDDGILATTLHSYFASN